MFEIIGTIFNSSKTLVVTPLELKLLVVCVAFTVAWIISRVIRGVITLHHWMKKENTSIKALIFRKKSAAKKQRISKKKNKPSVKMA